MTGNDLRVAARRSRHFLAIERRKPCKLLAVNAKEPSLLSVRLLCGTFGTFSLQPEDLKLQYILIKAEIQLRRSVNIYLGFCCCGI